MKRIAMDHPKTAKLAKLLRIHRWGAVGILECLWHFTAKHAIRGDIGRWSDKDIAQAMDWTGDPMNLIRALIEAGWLDTDGDHRLIVHDWPDHADKSVRRTLQNKGLTFAGFSKPEGHGEPKPVPVPVASARSQCQSQKPEVETAVPPPPPVSSELQNLAMKVCKTLPSANFAEDVALHGEAHVKEALLKAERMGGKPYNYIHAILTGWAKEGYPPPPGSVRTAEGERRHVAEKRAEAAATRGPAPPDPAMAALKALVNQHGGKMDITAVSNGHKWTVRREDIGGEMAYLHTEVDGEKTRRIIYPQHFDHFKELANLGKRG